MTDTAMHGDLIRDQFTRQAPPFSTGRDPGGGAPVILAGIASMTFTRITTDPKQMGGVPCIRGLRIPVATVVALVADGMTREEILADYPSLEGDDIQEALRF